MLNRLFAAISLSILTALGTGANAADLEKTKLVVGAEWKFVPNIAYWFPAFEFGWWEEAGLEIELLELQGTSANMAQLQTGGIDIGSVHGHVLAKASSEGFSGKMIMAYEAGAPFGVIALKDGPIQSPSDLAGTKLASVTGSGSALILPFFLDRVGVERNSVELQLVGWGMPDTLLLQKQVDGQAGYLPSIPVIESRGAEVISFPYSDFGLPTYTLGMVASDETIEKYPNTMAAFAQVFQRSVDWTRQNPREALEIFIKHNPAFKTADFDIVLAGLEINAATWSNDFTEANAIGWMDEARWVETIEFAEKNYGVDLTGKSPADFYTNAFLSK